MGPWRKNHNKTSECQKKWEMPVKSNLRTEENGITPLRHIPAQPTRRYRGLQHPRPWRFNYLPTARGT